MPPLTFRGGLEVQKSQFSLVHRWMERGFPDKDFSTVLMLLTIPLKFTENVGSYGTFPTSFSIWSPKQILCDPKNELDFLAKMAKISSNSTQIPIYLEN